MWGAQDQTSQPHAQTLLATVLPTRPGQALPAPCRRPLEWARRRAHSRPAAWAAAPSQASSWRSSSPSAWFAQSLLFWCRGGSEVRPTPRSDQQRTARAWRFPTLCLREACRSEVEDVCPVHAFHRAFEPIPRTESTPFQLQRPFVLPLPLPIVPGTTAKRLFGTFLVYTFTYVIKLEEGEPHPFDA